jgi:NitT/TauT family transport system permease protein
VIRQILTVLATLALVIALWHTIVVWRNIHPIILPTPAVVASTAWAERATLARAFLSTGMTALFGLAASIVCGSCIAVLFSQSAALRKAFYPYVIFLQTVPIVAIAPLLITWSGYSWRTVVLVAMIISLFPIISNVTTGLISVDQNLRDLFRLSRASRWQQLFLLHIPHAIPHLILGARISAGLAVIGTVVGEFFVGGRGIGNGGLGTIMTSWQTVARTDALIAAVLTSTLLGILMLGLVNLAAVVFLRRWTSNMGFESGA